MPSCGTVSREACVVAYDAADPAVQAAAIARLPDHLRRHADAKAFAGRGLLT